MVSCSGEMSEWSKEPDSKSGVVLCITEGSNPSLSEWRNIFFIASGEVSEWSKVHDWKSCMVESHRGFESPPLRLQQQILGYVRRPTPSGQECSSGKRNVHETETICCCFHFWRYPIRGYTCYNQPPEEEWHRPMK